ncbi:MAG: hypothetical protein ABW116_00910, partial [Candidatus Sedimenticola sp. 20ELBAFRAG]
IPACAGMTMVYRFSAALFTEKCNRLSKRLAQMRCLFSLQQFQLGFGYQVSTMSVNAKSIDN